MFNLIFGFEKPTKTEYSLIEKLKELYFIVFEVADVKNILKCDKNKAYNVLTDLSKKDIRY